MTLKQVEKIIEEKTAELKLLHEQRKELFGRRQIKCRKCGRKSKAAAWSRYRKRYYVPPHGCTGGDYWTSRPEQAQCPKCGDSSWLGEYEYISDRDAEYRAYLLPFREVMVDRGRV